MELNNTKLNARLESSAEEVKASAKDQRRIWNQLKDQMDEPKAQIKSGNVVTSRIAERFEWFQSLGEDIKNFMHGIFVQTFATYNIVVDIRNLLPSRPERSLYQEPFILEDPLGRIFPITMQFVNSWDAFDAVMGLQFRNLPGYRMVQQQQYVLRDSAANRDIQRRFPWEAELRPGQRIVMCMIFNDYLGWNGCPKCLSGPRVVEDVDVKW